MDTNPALIFFGIGIALIITELVVMQLSVVWLLLVGLAALVASLVLWLMPSGGWAIGVGVFSLALGAMFFALYKPMKRWQNSSSAEKGDTAIGQHVSVIEAITANSGKVRWSGSDWPARLASAEAATIESGQAEIVKFEGITVWVKAV